MTVEQLETFSNTKPELRYLTEEIIKYLGANPPGGSPSPGGGAYSVEEVTLTHTQILDLANGVEVLPAPGSGKLNVFMGAVCYMNTVPGSGYTFGANSKPIQFYYTPDLNVEASSPIPTGTVLNIAVWQFHPKMALSNMVGYEAYVDSNNFYAEESGAQGCANQAISLVLLDTTISGGHADNELFIKLFYVQMDVVPYP